MYVAGSSEEMPLDFLPNNNWSKRIEEINRIVLLPEKTATKHPWLQCLQNYGQKDQPFGHLLEMQILGSHTYRIRKLWK